MKKLFLLLFAMCFMALSAYADRTISGQVLDAATGDPLIGATIQGEGVNHGTATDVNGHFTLVLPDHVKFVNVSYIGYATRQVEVSPAYTQYRYRDRSKIYTYYLTKTESKESTEEPAEGNGISNIRHWVKYVEPYVKAE